MSYHPNVNQPGQNSYTPYTSPPSSHSDGSQQNIQAPVPGYGAPTPGSGALDPLAGSMSRMSMGGPPAVNCAYNSNQLPYPPPNQYQTPNYGNTYQIQPTSEMSYMVGPVSDSFYPPAQQPQPGTALPAQETSPVTSNHQQSYMQQRKSCIQQPPSNDTSLPYVAPTHQITRKPAPVPRRAVNQQTIQSPQDTATQSQTNPHAVAQGQSYDDYLRQAQAASPGPHPQAPMPYGQTQPSQYPTPPPSQYSSPPTPATISAYIPPPPPGPPPQYAQSQPSYQHLQTSPMTPPGNDYQAGPNPSVMLQNNAARGPQQQYQLPPDQSPYQQPPPNNQFRPESYHQQPNYQQSMYHQAYQQQPNQQQAYQPIPAPSQQQFQQQSQRPVSYSGPPLQGGKAPSAKKPGMFRSMVSGKKGKVMLGLGGGLVAALVGAEALSGMEGLFDDGGGGGDWSGAGGDFSGGVGDSSSAAGIGGHPLIEEEGALNAAALI